MSTAGSMEMALWYLRLAGGGDSNAVTVTAGAADDK